MRRPISRVRSVTDTSMMFMMPTPPTTREMNATAMSSVVMVSDMLVTMLEICPRSNISKSSSTPGSRLCSRRSTWVIWSMAGLAFSLSLILTMRLSTVRVRRGWGALV